MRTIVSLLGLMSVVGVAVGIGGLIAAIFTGDWSLPVLILTCSAMVLIWATKATHEEGP